MLEPVDALVEPAPEPVDEDALDVACDVLPRPVEDDVPPPLPVVPSSSSQPISTSMPRQPRSNRMGASSHAAAPACHDFATFSPPTLLDPERIAATGQAYTVTMRRLLLAITVSVVILACSVAAAARWLDEQGRDVPDGTFDAIVVLGCRVNPGGVPSHALERRAEHAARLYREGRAPLVVVTGGVGEYGPSEASVAAGVLARAGVPREAILLEDSSTSTWENASFARERFGGGRVLVVTDAFHTFRAQRIFTSLYDEAAAVGTHSPWLWPRVTGALREVVAVAIYASLERIDLLGSVSMPTARKPRADRGWTTPTRSFSDAALLVWWVPSRDPDQRAARRARPRRRACPTGARPPRS